MKKDPLSMEISRVVQIMSTVDPSSTEYYAYLGSLTALVEAKKKLHPSGVASDTMINAITNLLGIVTIVTYEHTHVLTSKALGFVSRLR